VIFIGTLTVMFLSTSNMILHTPDPTDSRIIHLQGCCAPVMNLSTDDVLVSQPFTYASLISGFGCCSGDSFMISEDFSVAGDFSVDELEIWMIYSSGTPVTQYNLGFQGDAGNGPDGVFVWQGMETVISNVNTGLTSWGYELWYAHVTISDCPVIPGPEVYWFCLQAESGPSVYWLGTDNPTGWGSMFYLSLDDGATWDSSLTQFGAPFATFFILQSATSLERCSWGEIKALFP